MAKCKFCDAEVQIGQVCEYCGSRAERWYYTESEKIPVSPIQLRRKTKESKDTEQRVDTHCAKAKLYTVQRGDTLWDIAKFFYGVGAEWPKIAEANKLKNPHKIYPGNILLIP